MPINKYQPVTTESRRTASPLRMLVGVWVTAAVLALVSAEGLHTMLAHKEPFPGRDLLLAGSTHLRTASRAIGLSTAHDVARSYAQYPLEHGPEVAFESRPGLKGFVAEAHADEQLLPTPVPTFTPIPEPVVDLTRHIPRTPPSKGRPVGKVVLVGASSIQYYLGAELERRLEATYGVEVHRLGKLSSSLTRPDYFDWPTKIDELIDEHQPDLVIAQFGGNDCQNIMLPSGRGTSFGTDAWDEEYAGRVRDFVTRMQAGGARAIMLGMPNMRSGSFSRRIKSVNALIREHAEAVGGTYIPTWDLTSDAFGKYQRTIEFEGEDGLMRLGDGIHYSRLGGKYVAEHVTQRLERHVALTPLEPGLATVHELLLASEHRQKETAYLAFVPRRIPAGGLPAVYLLHGAYDGYEAWANHDQRLLQRLAEEHRLVIVTPDGEPHGWYLDATTDPTSQIESYIMDELLADVERRLPVSCTRGIMGLSMGGNGAIKIALRHPGQFQAAASMSGVVDFTGARIRKAPVKLLGPYEEDVATWEANSAHHLARRYPERAAELPLFIACGEDDRWFETNVAFSTELHRLGIPHVFEGRPGGHSWDYWLEQLPRQLAWMAAQLARERVPAAASAPEPEPPTPVVG